MTDDSSRWPAYPAPGTWTQQESEDFVHARRILQALIGVWAQRIAAITDHRDKTLAREAREPYVELLRTLQVTDREIVQRIIADYPDFLHRMRAEEGP
jgi:hypothetical protein